MNFEFVFALFTLIITVQSDMKDTSEKGSRVTWRREPPFEEWVIEIEGGVRKAKMAARSMGLNYVSPVLGFDNMYVLHSKYKSRTSEEKVGRRIRRSPLVLWAQKQVPLVRAKRSTSSEFHWNDPLYPEMWYIHRASQGQGYDMNVLEAWGLGYTGKGVVVTIMDDGIDYTHPDLVANYDPWASYDMNDNDRDPMPNLKNPDNNRHGTRCAGQIAAQGNNSVCVVGIAYNAKIGGIRMLDGYITDRVEAQTLKFNQSYIDIYSGSWGPEDTGKLYEGPGALARKAFHSGILNGRKGFGNIYVWASGNGGSMGDSCACDGYASSPYTLSVSGVGERNSRPWYLEKCSSTLVTTYSSGTPAEKMISTIDVEHKCTNKHSGTSAAAPMAAGIIALLLEANPRLSWRDVQYITLLTANPSAFVDGNFTVNAVGRAYSQLYGYGLMDAGKMVRLGELWRGLPAHHECHSETATFSIILEGKFNHTISLNFSGCQPKARGASKSQPNSSEYGAPVKYLEHVQVYADIVYQRRGLLQLTLISPSGTETVLQPPRKLDEHSGNIGLLRWPVTTVQLWGENATGVWRVRLDNYVGSAMLQPWQKLELDKIKGYWRSVRLLVYGTSEFPIRLSPPNPKRPPPKDWFAPFSKYVVDDSKWLDVYTCHPECAPGGCTGPAADQCLGGCRRYVTQDRQCVATCPFGTTPYGALQIVHSGNIPWDTKELHRNRVKPNPSSRIRSSEIDEPLTTGLGNNIVCQPCSSVCAACVRPFTEYDCTSCPEGQYLVPLLTPDGKQVTDSSKLESAFIVLNIQLPYVSGTCQTHCPIGYHVDKSTLTCVACIENCAECVGSSVGECSLCKPGFRLVHGRCVDGHSIDGLCGPGKYLKHSHCVDCDASCDPAGCLSDGQCTICREGYSFLLNGTCVSSCPTGWYAGPSLQAPFSVVSAPENVSAAAAASTIGPRLCEPCPPGCKDCTTFNSCTTCLPGLELTDGRCTLAKSSLATKQSTQCSELCATCFSSKDDCLTCPPGKTLVATTNIINIQPYQTKFIFHTSSSERNTHLENSTKNSNASKTATHPTAVHTTASIFTMPTTEDPATAAHTGTLNVNLSVIHTVTYTCSSSCPSSTYLGHSGGQTVCRLCSPACAACAEASHCLSCSPDFYWDERTETCLPSQSCRQSEYFDLKQMACLPCDPSCATCQGPSASDCTSCRVHGPVPHCLRPSPEYDDGAVSLVTISNGSPVSGHCLPCCAYKLALIFPPPEQCMFCLAGRVLCLSSSEISAGEGGLLVEDSAAVTPNGPSKLALIIVLLLIFTAVSIFVAVRFASNCRRKNGMVNTAATRQREARLQAAGRRNHQQHQKTPDEDGAQMSLRPSNQNGDISCPLQRSARNMHPRHNPINPAHLLLPSVNDQYPLNGLSTIPGTAVIVDDDTAVATGYGKRAAPATDPHQKVLYSQLVSSSPHEDKWTDDENVPTGIMNGNGSNRCLRLGKHSRRKVMSEHRFPVDDTNSLGNCPYVSGSPNSISARQHRYQSQSS